MRPLPRFALTLLSVVPLALRGQATAALPPDFDAYVGRVLSTFQVPGVAVAIVKDGQVVLAKGYGVRTLGKPDAVDSLTRFGIDRKSTRLNSSH